MLRPAVDSVGILLEVYNIVRAGFFVLWLSLVFLLWGLGEMDCLLDPIESFVHRSVYLYLFNFCFAMCGMCAEGEI